jgi:lysylphosphatidylglycerol synthetase-like protein (DUF2156 family)
MVYCIANDMSYSSSFNIFAVVAGVLLIRQSLRTARVVAWFAAFMLAGFTGAALLFPMLTPVDLWLTQLKLHPIGTLSVPVIAAAAVAYVYWVYRNLTSPVVLEARRAAGLTAKRPIFPFVIGAALAIGLFGIMLIMTRGESADIAKAKAQEQLGPKYRYHITSMHWSHSGGRATLTAYNEHEIREVTVRW